MVSSQTRTERAKTTSHRATQVSGICAIVGGHVCSVAMQESHPLNNVWILSFVLQVITPDVSVEGALEILMMTLL